MLLMRMFLILAYGLLLLLVVTPAQAAITARVTYQSHAAYLANGNPAPGEIMFMRSDIPNAGNDNGGVANGNTARLVLSGNVTNAVVNLGSTPGHFTANFNHAGWSAASGCAITPINFFTSQYLADGQSIDITITCTMPDNTPPTLVSAATSTNGSQVILNWSEAINYYANGEDFRVYQNGTLRTITAASHVGSQLALTVSPAINAGTTVTLDYVDIGNLYDYAVNPPANFSGRPVTNNVSGGLPPNVTDARISIAGATGNGGVFRRGDSVTASWNNTASGDNNSGVTAVIVDFSQFGGAAVAATNNAGTWTASSAVAAGITASNRNVSITASNGAGSTTAADTSNATVDSVVPTVVSIAPASGASASNTTVNFTASFSEAVTGVSTDDFTLVGTGSATGSIASASGSGSSYTVTVNGITGNGTLKLNLNASTNISDTAGNSGLAAFTAGTTHTVAIATAPGAPTIGTATAGDAQASVSFSAPASNGGSAITGYTVTSNPGGITAGGNGFTTSPITLSGLSNGTAYTFTVTATNAVGTSTASAASNSVTPKANQTITFSNPGAQNFGTTPTLTASASSSLPVSFSSATTGVCTITSGGSLTFITAGSCTINATQAGNTVWQAASQLSQSFTVNPVVPQAPTIGTAIGGVTQASVSFSAPVNTGGSSITGYTVTASPDGATASGAASPLVVSGLSNGQAYTFTVTARNTAGEGPASAASIAVTPAAPQTITFANPGAQNFGTTPTLTASADSNLPVSFSSATPTVCTITSAGLLGFASTGNCSIDADQPGNASYLPAVRVSHTFSVNGVVPGVPTIGTVLAASASEVSVGFSAPLFDGGSPITGYTVVSSPDGINAPGTGSPITVSGLTAGTSYTFVVTASNANGTGAASAPSNAVTPVPPLAVAPVSATVAYGTASPINLAISGAASSVAVATAPAHGSAVVSGTTITYTPTPGYAGNDSFSYTASDAYTTTAAATVSITVSTPTVVIDTVSLAVATADSVYTQTLGSSGGALPYHYVVVSGALPAGLTLSSNGVLSGTPTAVGMFAFTVISTDSSSGVGPFLASQAYILQVGRPPLSVAPVTAALGYGTSASPVSLLITGTASSVAVATAPAHGSAVVSGTAITYTPTPGYAGNDSFSYTASDAYSTSAPALVSIVVAAPQVRMDTPALAAAMRGTAYVQALSSSGGTAPYTYALASGALPPGLRLSASGELSGTPTAAGQYPIAVTVTDSTSGTGPFSATASFTLNVDAATQQISAFIATPAEPVYVQGGSFQLGANGGGSGNPVRFASGTPAVCTVSGSTVTMLAAGSCALTADQDGNAQYQAAAQLSLEVVIAQGVPVVSWLADMDKMHGEAAFELPEPASTSDGAFHYSSSNPAVATVNGRTVTLVGAGITTLVAAQQATGNFAAATVQLQLSVNARPDPTGDVQVSGGLQAQVDASARFAQVQGDNIRGRLRQLRNGGNANDLRFALAYAGSPSATGLTLPVGSAAAAALPAMPQGWGLWLAGTATFGHAGRNGSARGSFDFNTGGISLGADRALGEDVLLGLAGSWGRQGTDFDGVSSRVDARQRSLAAYGLWQLGEHMFVDGLLGNGSLDFDLRRWSDAASATAQAVREGEQWFGALTLGHAQQTAGGANLTSYGRYDRHRATLAGYREHGLGMYDLAYAQQRIDNSALAVGLEASWVIPRLRGSWRPHGSIEYRSALDNRGDAAMNYVQVPQAGDYVLAMRSYNDEVLRLAAGVELQLDSGWLFSLLLGHEQGSNALRSQSIGLQLRYGAQGAVVPMYGDDAAARAGACQQMPCPDNRSPGAHGAR